MSCRDVIESIMKLIYQIGKTLQFSLCSPWVVLGVESLPADKIYEVAVLYLASEDVSKFLFFFLVNLDVLGLWLLTFNDWVRHILTLNKHMKNWVDTFYGKRL